ncbi:MAG TPA: DUF58 domain-containing protein [Candidatus Baltobacteraceae bacterium]|nr:DUF58 domain-containing protein [Candidatus Baltobacteraceae bacterium]
MTKVRIALPLWCTVRLYWVLGAIAFLLACSPALPVFVPVAIACAVLIFIAIAADIAAGPPRASVTVERVLPPHFALGSSAALTYDIENRSPAALRCGMIEGALRTLRAPGEPLVVHIPAEARTRVTVAMTPVERGSDAFGAIYMWYENRIGLLRRRVRIAAHQEFRVYPDLSAVERYGALHVRNKVLEAGLRRMRMRGAGTEFESLREFAAGDAFRAIDWKATARRGKLMVMQREVERSQDVMLVLDCGRLMTSRIGETRKLDYAITAALSLASVASLAHDRVGVAAFAANLLTARAPRSTAGSLRELADAVCDLEPRFEEADYARVATYLRAHLGRRSLIVLFTDVIDPVAQSTVLAELASLAKRHVVLCVLMNDAAVEKTLATVPETAADAYRLDVAIGLSQERAEAARILMRRGINVLDVPAAQLSLSAIDEYLRIKVAGRL